MRVKQIWSLIPLPTNLKLIWDRIAFSRLTAAYFIFSLLHFIIQLAFQAKAFTINADAARYLNSLVVQGQTTNAQGLPLLRGSTLHMCSWVPSNLDVDVDSCAVVWGGTRGNITASASPNAVESAPDMSSIISIPTIAPITVTETATVLIRPASSTLSVSAGTTVAGIGTSVVTSTPTSIVLPVANNGSDEDEDRDHDEGRDDDDGDDGEYNLKRSALEFSVSRDADGGIQIQINGHDSPLTSTCLQALNWPVVVLGNTKREDIVFIAFQFWVLGMSVVALLNESIPHILASLLTHIAATAWAAFQITHTANFRANFTRVITEGACGVQLLPTYWQDRGRAEIPSLTFNVFAMLVSCFLTWKLIKLFGWQTFKRVGASLTINRIYKIVLILSITIQLCLFFMVVTVSLWVDQLMNSVIGDLAEFQTLYRVTSFITLVLSIPWLMLGWFGVRRELRVAMFIFLVLSILYLAGWSVMFFSTTFRWTFVTWSFFSVMACASVFLTVLSFILGVVCRYNFGKGLPRYLNAQELEGDDYGYYGSPDFEKVDFPSNEKPIPTYSAAFGSGPEVPPPGQKFTSRLGPRFFNNTGAHQALPLSHPPAVVVRTPSNGSNGSSRLSRSDTSASDRSFASVANYYHYSPTDSNHSRSDSQQSGKPKRWVIE